MRFFSVIFLIIIYSNLLIADAEFDRRCNIACQNSGYQSGRKNTKSSYSHCLCKEGNNEILLNLKSRMQICKTNDECRPNLTCKLPAPHHDDKRCLE